MPQHEMAFQRNLSKLTPREFGESYINGSRWPVHLGTMLRRPSELSVVHNIPMTLILNSSVTLKL